MPFVKLDCGMLNSTLWIDRPAREVFITALLMAEPHELLNFTPQLSVESLDQTGWMVPPGWYGLVEAAGVGIIRRAEVEDPIGRLALERLGSPDPGSRSQAFDGRRLVRIDGGYVVLNFMAYRDRDYTAARRAERYRQRQRLKSESSRRDVTPSHRDITQAEAEAEAEVQVDQDCTVGAQTAPTRKRRRQRSPDISKEEALYQAFRTAYPISRRVGGKLARQAFTEALTGTQPAEQVALMLAALEQHKTSAQWQDARLIPLMTTWLRQERWCQRLPSPSDIVTAEETRQRTADAAWIAGTGKAGG